MDRTTSSGNPLTALDLRALVECPRGHGHEKQLHDHLKSLGGLEGIEASLKTSRTQGIAGDERSLEHRREKYGKNEIETKPPATYLELIWEAMGDTTLILLVIAGTVSLILGLTVEEDKSVDWIEGAAILISVAIVANVTAANDWMKEKQFRELNKVIENVNVNVVRDGNQILVPMQQLVVGDLVTLETGNKIYADGLLTIGQDLQIDESSQTGESELVRKNYEFDPILLSGTTVRQGSGQMLVIAVGPNSQAGVISALILKSKGLAKDEEKKKSDTTSASPTEAAAAAAPASPAALSVNPHNEVTIVSMADEKKKGEDSGMPAVQYTHGTLVHRPGGSMHEQQQQQPHLTAIAEDGLPEESKEGGDSAVAPADVAAAAKSDAIEAPPPAPVADAQLPRSGTGAMIELNPNRSHHAASDIALAHAMDKSSAVSTAHSTTTALIKKDGKSVNGDEDEDEEAGDSSAVSSRSVLATKLDRVAITVGKAGALIAAIVVSVMVIVWAVSNFYSKYCSDNADGCSWNKKTDPALLVSFFITGVTILVVAVPEGLPLAVTLSLAFSGYRMRQEKNLVRHLYACETMGSATTICTDKTGTLTTNVMTVSQSLLSGVIFSPIPAGPIAAAKEYLWNLALNVALNSHKNSRLETKSDGKVTKHGNPTECGLLSFMRDVGSEYDYEALRKSPLFHYADPVKEFPFSSSTKWSGIVVPYVSREAFDAAAASGVAATPEGLRLYAKGAPERCVDLCTDVWWSADDTTPPAIVPLTPEIKQAISTAQGKFADAGLRTLALMCKTLTDEEADNVGQLPPEVTRGSTLLAIVGIADPIRPEVPKAIAQCHTAGVTVIMCTGDHISTACSIADQAGILKKNDPVYTAMTGDDFRQRILRADGTIIQSEFDKIWPTLRVLARCSPTDKYNLVTGLQQSELYRVMLRDPSKLPAPIYTDKQVVAVTGDGTNDAPALSKADVGFAMGINGTDVARSACDIVLMDDNFSSIVVACKWGRNVYDSVSKFLQFQLTVNISAVTIAVIGSVIYNESPLKAVQLLWVNLIMDAFASLALATEPPSEDMLLRPPYGRNRLLISRQMWFNIFGQVIYQLTVLLSVVFVGDKWFDVESARGANHDAKPMEHYTVVFNMFVLMQICNEINCRLLYGELNMFKGIQNNKWFIIIVFGTLVAQALITEFGSLAFKTTHLSWDLWLWCCLFALLSFPVQIIINLIARVMPQHWPWTKKEVPPAEEAALPAAPLTEKAGLLTKGGTESSAAWYQSITLPETAVTVAAPAPAPAASPFAQPEAAAASRPSLGWSTMRVVTRLIGSRTRARTTMNNRMIEDLSLSSSAEAARRRRMAQIAMLRTQQRQMQAINSSQTLPHTRPSPATVQQPLISPDGKPVFREFATVMLPGRGGAGGTGRLAMIRSAGDIDTVVGLAGVGEAKKE